MSEVKIPTNEDEMKAAIAEATKGIRAELTEERNARKAAEKQFAEIKGEIDALKSNQNAAVTDAEKKKLEAEGQYGEALKKVEETYAKKFADLDAALKARDKKIEELLIDGKILSLAENAVNPQQAVVLIKASHQFEVKDGSVTVKSADGRPLLDNHGQPVTVEGAYANFIAENPHLAKPGTTSGGSGQRANMPGPAGAGGIDAALKDAIKRGDRHEIIKQKMLRMGQEGGPHGVLAGETGADVVANIRKQATGG